MAIQGINSSKLYDINIKVSKSADRDVFGLVLAAMRDPKTKRYLCGGVCDNNKLELKGAPESVLNRLNGIVYMTVKQVFPEKMPEKVHVIDPKKDAIAWDKAMGKIVDTEV